MKNSVLHFPKNFSFLFFSLFFFCPDLMEIVQEQRHECKVLQEEVYQWKIFGRSYEVPNGDESSSE